MIVGRGFPTRAEDIRQYRLFYLIKYHFKGLPSESDVSSMFKETQSKSKSLIRQVLSRFRYELEDEINNALKTTLCNSKHYVSRQKREFRVTIYSDIIVEELNRIIDREAPKRQRVKKLTGTGRTYVISCDTFCKLKSFLEPDRENYPDCPDIECPPEEED